MTAIPSIGWAMHRVQLFRTRDMGWIGKGGLSLRAGDDIWLVPGAKVAFALRRLPDGTHCYVGHVYVHGVMQEEASALFEGKELVDLVLV